MGMIPGYDGETYGCYRCGMTFRVEAPAFSTVERSRCAICNRLHWSTGGKSHNEPAKVGIDPGQLVNGEWV